MSLVTALNTMEVFMNTIWASSDFQHGSRDLQISRQPFWRGRE